MGDFQYKSAKDSIAEEIRKLIYRGDLAPGARISLDDLTQRFGLSRTPVRDAIMELRGEGLTDVRPRVGVFVRIISDQEALDVYRIKASLEPLAAGLAAERGAETDRIRFFRSGSKLVEAAEERDIDRYISLLEERRDTMFALADSQPIRDAFSLLDGRVRLLRFRNLSEPSHLEKSARENLRVAEAIMQGDAAGARSLAALHGLEAVERVEALLREDRAQAGS